MKVLKILGLTLLVCCLGLVLFFYEGDIPRDVVDARYTSIDSQFADFGDLGRIHYRDQGDRRALPVVLLHGAAASLHTFEPWADRLQDEFRIITFDLPAHGLTGEVPSGDYSTTAMLDVVDRVTESLGLSSFVLGGNSMGGGIAWRYALSRPGKVQALVLIDAAGSRAWRREHGDHPVTGFSLLGQSWFRSIAQVVDPYFLVSQGLKTAFFDESLVDETMIMRYNDMILREGTRKAFLGRRSGSNDKVESPEILRAIKVPTLVMWGKEDRLLPFTSAAYFTDHIPDTTTAYYDGVGHIPMEEIPEQSAEDLADFLSQLSSTGN